MVGAPAKVSEREAVLRERRAAANTLCGFVHPDFVGAACDRCAEQVAPRYPLPKVERPRVVRDPDGAGYEFRVVAGCLEERTLGNGTWRTASGWCIVAARAALWADLFANPTELVEDGSTDTARVQGVVLGKVDQ